MKAEYRKKSQIAFGVALICIVFLVETAFAHRKMPSPASPVIWAALGTVAACAVAYGLWCRHCARMVGREQQAPRLPCQRTEDQ